jgi:hypothetical protein
MTTTRKEIIAPPTRKELSDAARQTVKGHSSGGRVLAEQRVAIGEGVAKKHRVGKRLKKRVLGYRVAAARPTAGRSAGKRGSSKRMAKRS